MAGKVSELKAEVRALVKMRASNKKAAESTKRNGEKEASVGTSGVNKHAGREGEDVVQEDDTGIRR